MKFLVLLSGRQTIAVMPCTVACWLLRAHLNTRQAEWKAALSYTSQRCREDQDHRNHQDSPHNRERDIVSSAEEKWGEQTKTVRAGLSHGPALQVFTWDTQGWGSQHWREGWSSPETHKDRQRWREGPRVLARESLMLPRELFAPPQELCDLEQVTTSLCYSCKMVIGRVLNS